ncbi:hypothetical protein BDV93DRAFT_512440 [Ceratobasidium sp. AG-I]|nr:hypothetical protein BDV93DRAFT_512440 [Ceratobasidium sp. AG-I]
MCNVVYGQGVSHAFAVHLSGLQPPVMCSALTCIGAKSASLEDTSLRITLYDFHSPIVRRFPASPIVRSETGKRLPSLVETSRMAEEGQVHVHTVIIPTVTETPMFCHRIVSRLPYRTVMSVKPIAPSEMYWRINGEHLVLTTVGMISRRMMVYTIRSRWLTEDVSEDNT